MYIFAIEREKRKTVTIGISFVFEISMEYLFICTHKIPLTFSRVLTSIRRYTDFWNKQKKANPTTKRE